MSSKSDIQSHRPHEGQGIAMAHDAGMHAVVKRNLVTLHLVLEVNIADRLTPHVANVHFRSEEHTSELQSHLNLVCRLLLEKKKNTLLSSRRTPFSILC